MFDISPKEIKELNDTDLRELVGRLCEAELVSRGLSPAAVTWGGHQTAADGGLDVRVSLPPRTNVEGFISRPETGFQVKTPDMPRADIIAEMRPAGAIRPVIQELADNAGAYVIVSSNGSTADIALRNRRNAMCEALAGVANADQLHTDFYDRTRLATWVRRHPGIILWVKEKVGRAHAGWRPYGPWSGAAGGADAEYLLDEKLRLHLGKQRDAPAQPVLQAIDELRNELDQPGKIVRLVGLSGVGKTRFVQALFDSRIGARPLAPSLAVYTNLSDNPMPQPTGLASDLIANATRAVLIVDNCPPDLHRSLSELCRGQTSTVSVLTVEYDVRDDQPEGTQIVTLDTASLELIAKLVKRRYSHLSHVNAQVIAEASGGNARIAIALAETVERSESIAGLSNDELFQRLFRQRHEPDNALLNAAQACSLVYSFHSEAIDGAEAELPRLASLAGQSATETYRHVGELLRRDLVQQRGVWRAVLPHAIANRLAVRALEDTPYDIINQQLVEGGTERLTKSFSRRLSFLHDNPQAVAIVESWLAPEGFLGDVAALSELGQAMFENVAPVSPEGALAALERAGSRGAGQHVPLLRSLAYDPLLFERSSHLLVQVAIECIDEHKANDAAETFASLFTIYLSGTHATIEHRLAIIERLLRSAQEKLRSLGLAALDNVLETTHFGTMHRFEFGARSRNYGYQPRSDTDVTRWYNAALSLIEHLALTEGMLKPELSDLLARNFRGLWPSMRMHDQLERLSRGFAEGGFWLKGWVACLQTIRLERNELTSEAASRLSSLEADLHPTSLSEQVRAVVLGDWLVALDREDTDADDARAAAFERADALVRELGAAVAADDLAFGELLPDLLRGGGRLWEFGRGLAAGSLDSRASWARLVGGLERLDRAERNVQVLRGYLAEIWERDTDLAQCLLDEALDHPVLVVFLPVLQVAILDQRGVERLKQALNGGQVPASMYGILALGRAVAYLAGAILKELLLLIADQPDGFDVALDILRMRLFSDRSARRNHDPELLEVGRDLLSRVTFRRSNQLNDQHLKDVVKACLATPDDGPIAAHVAEQLRRAVATFETYSFHNDHLLAGLLEVQPLAVLDALFAGDERDRQAGVRVFDQLHDHRLQPADVIDRDTLIAWCERDREGRYPLAASIISFAQRSQPDGCLEWSEPAKVLLASAPDPRSVLAVFIERFRPMSWSGSRAALIEANARLLDYVEPHIPSNLASFLADAQAELARDVERERQWETDRDRVRDERFE